MQGPPNRVDLRHKQGQDKEFYQILSAFKTLYEDYESPIDEDERSKWEI